MLGTATASWADGDWSPPDTPPPPKNPAPADPGVITSEVKYKRSYDGPGPKMSPGAGSEWAPPACWYEPRYTAKQFEDYLSSRYVSASNAYAEMAEKYGVDNYHEGDKGA